MTCISQVEATALVNAELVNNTVEIAGATRTIFGWNVDLGIANAGSLGIDQHSGRGKILVNCNGQIGQGESAACLSEQEARSIIQANIQGAKAKAFNARQILSVDGTQSGWAVDYAIFPSGSGCIGTSNDLTLHLDCQGQVKDCR